MGFVVRHGQYPPPYIDRKTWGYRGTEGGEPFADEKTPVDVEIVAEKHGEKVVDPRSDHYLALIAGGCSAVFLTGGVYDLESMKKMTFASTLYDKKNKKVVQLGDTHFEYVKLDDIKSDLLIQTFVAVEDRQFYSHNGVDWKSIGRATVRNLLAMGAVEGAGPSPCRSPETPS